LLFDFAARIAASILSYCITNAEVSMLSRSGCRLLLLLLGLCCAPTKAQSFALTMLQEFSEGNADAYHLQHEQWQLLLRHAAGQLAVRYEHVSLQRSLLLARQSGYCTMNKRRSAAREADYLFSAYPLNLGAALQLVHLSSLQLPAAVDLASWLQSSPRLKIGVAQGRVYGEPIDQLIAQQPQHFYQLQGADVHLKLWDMLNKGRVDAIIDYQARFSTPRAGQVPLAFSRIAGIPLYISGYLMCSKTAHGEQAIALFNRLLAEPVLQQQLLQSYRQYFTAAQWQQVLPELQRLYQSPQ
jgi:uncharacterized protein (TIGR02285 family)